MPGLDRRLEPDEPKYTSVTCAFCYEPIAAGEFVRETYDYEIVHDDCWPEFCDEMYSSIRGMLNEYGQIV